MAYLSETPRQLAPTVGPMASGASTEAESRQAGIGNTIVIGIINYFGGVPYVVPDSTWVPAARGFNTGATIPFGQCVEQIFKAAAEQIFEC